MMKWYNVELNKTDADLFRVELKKSGVKYEASAAYNMIHFEVYCDAATAEKLENILQGL